MSASLHADIVPVHELEFAVPTQLSIALFIPSLEIGGAQIALVRLAGAFAAAGHRVTMVVQSTISGPELPLPPGVGLSVLAIRRTRNCSPALARFAQEWGADALISALPHNNIAAIMASRLARRRFVVIATEHAPIRNLIAARQSLSYRVLPAILHMLYPLSDAVVCASNGIRSQFGPTMCIMPTMHTIFNPVVSEDLPDRKRPTPGDVPTIVAAGRLEPEKDFVTLLHAFAILRAHRPARLVIAGDGAERVRLGELAEALGIAGHVEFSGFTNDLPALLARADVFALTSRFEGFGNVIVEALAHGTPVVATDCPVGPREILVDRRLGTLVPVGDAAAVAAALSEMLDTTPDRDALRRRALDFTVGASMSGYETVIRRAIAARVPSARAHATRGSMLPVFGFTPSPLDETSVVALVAGTRPPPGGPSLIVTPNLDHVVQLRRNPDFRAAYQNAALVLCDGFPVQYYARLRGHAPHRVTGCDVVARLLADDGPIASHRIMVVADRVETVQAIERWAAARGMTERVAAIVPGFGFIDDPAACIELAAAIVDHRPDILLMGVGAPQSEIFINRYRDSLPDCWALCVGQAVKIALGMVRRAPPTLRTLHAEWLWRLGQEPRRLAGRYGIGACRFAGAILADLRSSTR